MFQGFAAATWWFSSTQKREELWCQQPSERRVDLFDEQTRDQTLGTRYRDIIDYSNQEKEILIDSNRRICAIHPDQ